MGRCEKYLLVIVFSFLCFIVNAQEKTDKKLKKQQAELEEQIDDYNERIEDKRDSKRYRLMREFVDSIGMLNASLENLNYRYGQLLARKSELDSILDVRAREVSLLDEFVKGFKENKLLAAKIATDVPYSQMDIDTLRKVVDNLKPYEVDRDVASYMADIGLAIERVEMLQNGYSLLNSPYDFIGVKQYRDYLDSIAEGDMTKEQYAEYLDCENGMNEYSCMIHDFHRFLQDTVNVDLDIVYFRKDNADNEEDFEYNRNEIVRILDSLLKASGNVKEERFRQIPYMYKVYLNYISAMKKNPFYNKVSPIVRVSYKNRTEYLKGVDHDVESGEIGRIERGIEEMVKQVK